ncbi:hypothetical protein DW352_15035 [Pseudolabrys taiwanensis]|uniref:Flagellar FliJ protein n=1 Tax=Pseudolabrys taiwanensis TaxID=331696 RepID=A0A345ZXS4_9HYPH|nr:hypothetical protein [Pseudolabrys taiwanensis]AXK81721.1 hypothetical protein DW352_15035 [Pseudolabrys taiwanensis]
MKTRDRKIRRIVAVQEQLHRMAEWQLMESQAKERELHDRQLRLIGSFSGEGGLAELVAQVASRSLRVASVEHSVRAEETERHAAVALDEMRKLKHALKMAEVARKRAAHAQEKRVLEDVMGRMALRSAGTAPVEAILPVSE